MGYGSFSDETIINMMRDYIYQGKTMKEIAEHYKTSKTTVFNISKKYNWQGRKRYREEQLEKNGTVKRASTASKIVGRMMRVIDKHSIQIEMLVDGKAVDKIIPFDLIEQSYMAMGYMDKISKLLKEAKETMTPEQLVVIAPELDWSAVEKRYNENQDRGQQQLKEWQESRNPAIKEKEKESEDVFDAQSSEVKDQKEDKKKVIFEGIEEKEEEIKPINSIGALSD